jgi:hypothetical protein
MVCIASCRTCNMTAVDTDVVCNMPANPGLYINCKNIAMVAVSLQQHEARQQYSEGTYCAATCTCAGLALTVERGCAVAGIHIHTVGLRYVEGLRLHCIQCAGGQGHCHTGGSGALVVGRYTVHCHVYSYWAARWDGVHLWMDRHAVASEINTKHLGQQVLACIPCMLHSMLHCLYTCRVSGASSSCAGTKLVLRSTPWCVSRNRASWNTTSHTMLSCCRCKGNAGPALLCMWCVSHFQTNTIPTQLLPACMPSKAL